MATKSNSNIGAELWHWRGQEDGAGTGAGGGGGGGGSSHQAGAASALKEFGSTGMQLSVCNVGYSITVDNKKKQLLDDVSFRLEPGDMAALMGPSGAGKSTLLDLVAGRKLIGYWCGDVLINGRPRSPFFGRDSAYVLQDDVHISTLTVRETLRFAVRFRMEDKTPKAEREARVQALIQMLELHTCADSPVGDSLIKGISGGQLKRLSIGVEIAHMPSLIFLDEPTSGLDSAIAYEVMAAVRNLANQNRTIVSTIHQPSPETFALFDKVLLLSAGKAVYFGPADEAVAYFCKPELGYEYELNSNPADFIIDVSGGVILPKGQMDPRRPNELAEIYEASSFYVNPASERQSMSPEVSQYTRKHAAMPMTQFTTLVHRGWISSIRRKDDIYANLGKNIVVGILLMCVFWAEGNVESNDDAAVHGSDLWTQYAQPSAAANNVASLVFFAMMYFVMGNLQAIPQLCDMNVLYRRELMANAYSPFPYWLAAAIVQLPIIFCFHVLFTNISFWSIQFPEGKFAYYFFCTFLVNLCGFYFAQLLAASTGSSALALAVFPVTFLFFSSFSGFTIKLPNVDPGWKWATYISFLRWSYEGLMVNEFKPFHTYCCKTDDVMVCDVDDDDNYSDDDWDCDDDGELLLEEYGFDGYDKDNAYPITMIFIVVFSVLTYVCLRPPRSTLEFVTNKALLLEDEAAAAGDLESLNGNGAEDPLLGDGDEHKANGSAGGKSSGRQSLVRTASNMAQRLTMGSERGRTGSFEDAGQFPVRSTYTVDYYRQSTGDVSQVMSRGLRLVFLDVKYSVPDPKDPDREFQILKGISGRVHPGEMCALMGASGAGKSTLLDVIADRKNKGNISGQILFDGHARTIGVMRRTAYVMQDNVHIGILTVKQTLMYAARLRMDVMEETAREVRVNKIMDMLGLPEVQDTIVGTPWVRGVSGGQLKRLSIAVEIINLPDMIFLDEPTTGLDSAIAFEVMAAVRNLANQNRTVICTIHQPSPQVYDLFDKLLLLAAGKTIYFGHAKEAVPFYTNGVFGYHFVQGSNPADFVINVAGGFIPASDGHTCTDDELAAHYSKSEMHEAFEANIETMIMMDQAAVTTQQEDPREYAQSTWFQFKTLAHRQTVKTLLNRRPLVASVIRHILIGLFYGTIYYKLGGGQISERMSLLFFCLVFVVLGHQQAMPIIFEERLLFYRERGAKAYSTVAYWASTIVMTVPVTAVNVLLFSLITYSLTGLHKGVSSSFFGYFYINLLLSSYCGYFVCQLIAAAVPSAQAAISAFPAVLFFFIAFAGFIVTLPSLPFWLRAWGPKVSFFRWAFQGDVLNELRDNPDINMSQEEYDSYISSLGFDKTGKNVALPILFATAAVFRIATYLCMEHINYEAR